MIKPPQHMAYPKTKKLPKHIKTKQKGVWVLDPSKCLAQSQVKKIFAICKKRGETNKRSALIESIVVPFLFLTGLRRSELANLKWKHIFLHQEEPYIIVELGKTKHSRRVIPIHPYLVDLISKYKERLSVYTGKVIGSSGEEYFLINPSGGRYSGYGVYKIFKRIMDNTNILHKSPHTARHTFASNLYVASGHDLKLVQTVLGHSSIKITEVYTHVNICKIKIACDRLYNNLYQR